MVKMDKDFSGKVWGTITENEEDLLLKNSSCVDPKTGESPTRTGKCIVKLTENFSVVGHYTMGSDEDLVEIDDDERIYRTKK